MKFFRVHLSTLCEMKFLKVTYEDVVELLSHSFNRIRSIKCEFNYFHHFELFKMKKLVCIFNFYVELWP